MNNFDNSSVVFPPAHAPVPSPPATAYQGASFAGHQDPTNGGGRYVNVPPLCNNQLIIQHTAPSPCPREVPTPRSLATLPRVLICHSSAWETAPLRRPSALCPSKPLASSRRRPPGQLHFRSQCTPFINCSPVPRLASALVCDTPQEGVMPYGYGTTYP